MEAQVGYRIVIKSRTLGEHVREGVVREVHGADGDPPDVVEWIDKGRAALVFPGPDAHIVPKTPTV
jgi:hypothetical protein